ncbi:MAG: response regulator [Verrucomicrobia bacterium]|nr:response regulator [Verrucomicrobiota bacterium]
MHPETMTTLLEPSPDKASDAPTRRRTNPSNRILLVEDDISILQLTAHVLVRSDYQVEVAEDGEAAWELLQTRSYDLVITDNHMPRLSGLELVAKLRSAHMTVPVILASGLLDAEELSKHQWLQLAATLSKPFATDELLDAVKEALRAAAKHRSDGRIGPPVPAETFSGSRQIRCWGINE